MNIAKHIASLALISAALVATHSFADAQQYVRLVDPLDEPEFYCLDLSGWGNHLKLEDPLQAHTCKIRGGDDQMFSIEDGKILVGDTGRCLEVAGSGAPLPGSAILARKCSDSALQTFTLDEDGRITVTGSDLCLVVGSQSTDASGPSHMWRVLSIAPCDTTNPKFMIWQIGL